MMKNSSVTQRFMQVHVCGCLTNATPYFYYKGSHIRLMVDLSSISRRYQIHESFEQSMVTKENIAAERQGWT